MSTKTCRFKIKLFCSSGGCATSIDLFWKLNTLQNFIHDLFWPDEVFATHLEQRLKLMACDMIEACASYTLAGFQQWERKGNRWTASTDYIIPSEMCCMINVLIEAKNQSLLLCTFNGHDTVSHTGTFFSSFIYHFITQNQYHAKIDNLVDNSLNMMQKCLITKVNCFIFQFDFALNSHLYAADRYSGKLHRQTVSLR